jgi:flagellar motor switch protein FliG
MLMTALKGADEIVKEKFLGNMSQRAKIMFLDDMEAKGEVKRTPELIALRKSLGIE